MVQVIHAGPQAFDMLLYPEQNPINTYYIQEQLGRFTDTLTATGSAFISGAKALFEEIQNSDMVRKAKAAIRAAQSYFHPNMIRPLETLEQLQAADLGMQRWIMAQPTIRQFYHDGLVNGYSDTYTDMHPDEIGEAHYDYRRVMDGIIVGGDETTPEEWSYTHYHEDLLPGDRHLEFHEQVDILRTWEIIEMFAAAREEDPTNPFGGEMG